MSRMYLPPSTPAEPELEQVEIATDTEPEPEPAGGRGEEEEDSGADPVLVTEPAPLRPPVKKAAAKKTTAVNKAGKSDG